MTENISKERAWYGPFEYLLAALILGLMGMFFWAIRGTGGYGGSAGGMLAGLGWAMLWYGLSCHGGQPRHRPYGTGHIIAAIMLGITVGGLTGYGVYVSWVNGNFLMGVTGATTIRPISSLPGFAMMFLCGLHWGGVTGAFMAWCAPQYPVSKQAWFLRIGTGITGAVIAYFVAAYLPQLFLPFYKEGIYNEENRDCIRAAGAIKNILPHVGLYIGFLAFECIRKDWRAVKVMLIMGIGFAMAFTLGAFWFRCEGAMPWWKFWEMSIGLGGGLSFGFAFYLLNEADEKKHSVLITAGERYFAMGLVVLLGIANVVASGYEGFSRLHKLDLPTSMRFLVTLGLVVIVIIAYLFWLRRSKERKSSRSHVRIPLLPTGAISMILGLIVVSGYLVSMPKNISSNIILLTIYTICILVSVVFGGILEYRSRI